MTDLKGYQRKYLRSLAHGVKPSVMVGRKGITPSLLKEIAEELDRHELIKVKFVDFTEKSQKQDLSAIIEDKSGSRLIGVIGHTAIFYKQHSEPEKRKITLPKWTRKNDE